MVLQNGLGFILAYALWRELPGARFHRIAVFLPVVLSTIIVAYLFKLFYHPLFGVVNISLRGLGLDGLAQPRMRHSITHKGPDTFVFTMYSDMGQGETKDGEIVYTRRK